jgi:hypothetical protein
VNPTVVQRAKQRGLSSVGYANERHLLTEHDENRYVASKIHHLLDFDEPKQENACKSRSQARGKCVLKRAMTETIECQKVRCIPKSDLRNLKVAVIGVKLL